MLNKYELPVHMKSKFWRAINLWMGSEDTTYCIDENWQIYFCKDSNHYYAVQTDPASTITANTACIRKAYRIDPKTGDFLSEKLHDEDEEEHFIFAVKLYDSRKTMKEAQLEQETLKDYQFAENLFTIPDSHEQKPVVISIFYPGLPLTDFETVRTQDFIKKLTFVERIDLCYQLAKQYYNLHHHLAGAKLHIDVKGQNTMVYQLSDGRWRARLIDFGSVIKPGEKQEVSTTIAGMTPYAIAPEVISEVKSSNGYFQVGKASGTVSEKTDIYAFSAIVMSLLGADHPYNDRCERLKLLKNIPECYDIETKEKKPAMYDMQTYKDIVSANFKENGLFQNAKLNYCFSGTINCYFKRVHGLALEPEKVLETQKDHNTCYLAYDDYLLYKDGGRVFGYARPLRNIDKALGDLKSDAPLNADVLAKFDTLSGYTRKKNGASLQTLLQEKIQKFIKTMHAEEPENRPSSEEVFKFFKTVHAMCHLSEFEYDVFDVTKTKKNELIVERYLKLMLVKLDLLIQGIFYQCPLQDFDNLVTEDNFFESFENLEKYIENFMEHLRKKLEPPNPHHWVKSQVFCRANSEDEHKENFAQASSTEIQIKKMDAPNVPACSGTNRFFNDDPEVKQASTSFCTIA